MKKCCEKYGRIAHVRGALDGRPLFSCKICGEEWTEGNPYADSDDRLICIATYDRWRIYEGLTNARIQS